MRNHRTEHTPEHQHYDAVIIGSGFGGAMTASVLVDAGLKVLMLEQGGWVKRGPVNWSMNASVDLTPHYSMDSPLRVIKGGNKKVMGSYSCVGGPSVFYGGVSFRFRENDFHPPREIVARSGARWPIDYADLEPYYFRAEQILGVAGDETDDPTAPRRSAPYPQKPDALADISIRVKHAARRLGLNPSHLPLAINYSENGRHRCVNSTVCDTFACAIGAKNDLATVLIPKLQRKGMRLLPNTIVTGLITRKGRVTAVEAVNKTLGKQMRFTADKVILSAGAMGSPHLLLGSGLQHLSPGGSVIGRYLMRHVNAIVFGVFPSQADREERFHKQLGILDYYFGHPSIAHPRKKLGSLQQMPTPPPKLVKEFLPKPLGNIISPVVKQLTGLLAMAEDQPQHINRIELNNLIKDDYGLPQRQVSHEYSPRDRAALTALVGAAKQIMLKTGAWSTYVHQIKTFSHAYGTVRMGDNPRTAALDRNCLLHGSANLYVVDGSFMPTAAAVNPSLTISANALRVGEVISKK